VESRIKTKIWIQSFIRRLDGLNYHSTIIFHGDDSAGSILIKVNNLDNMCRVFSQVRNENNKLTWFCGTGKDLVSEDFADEYIMRQKSYDQDLWAIEVEDPRKSFTLDDSIYDKGN
tara:strand:- start:763 stop:1110 length:348 start_codon:yes stop_codon:yes gene_type:complete